MNAKRKVADILRDLQRVAPNRSRYLQLYADESETLGEWNAVTLYTIFRSSDGDVMMRPHVFEKHQAMNAEQWAAWFTDHPDPRKVPKYPDGRGSLTRILRDNILPGLTLKTGNTMQWQVLRIVGWRANVVPKSDDAAKHRNKRETKSSGESRG